MAGPGGVRIAVPRNHYVLRILLPISNIFLQEKAVEATKQKEETRTKPKPGEQEGMPHRRHCPLVKRRGDVYLLVNQIIRFLLRNICTLQILIHV
jgi:ribosomal protein L36